MNITLSDISSEDASAVVAAIFDMIERETPAVTDDLVSKFPGIAGMVRERHGRLERIAESIARQARPAPVTPVYDVRDSQIYPPR